MIYLCPFVKKEEILELKYNLGKHLNYSHLDILYLEVFDAIALDKKITQQLSSKE